MDPVNPNSLNKDLPLLPVQQNVTKLVSSDFPESCLHVYNIPYSLAEPLDIATNLYTYDLFQPIVQRNQFLKIHQVSIIIDCWQPGAVICGAISHLQDDTSDFADILSCQSHFMERIVDLKGSTITHELPFHSGMSQQIKPVPINGNYPKLLLRCNILSQGVVTVRIHYERGGPMIERGRRIKVAEPTPPTRGRQYDQVMNIIFDALSEHVHTRLNQEQTIQAFVDLIRGMNLSVEDFPPARWLSADVLGTGLAFNRNSNSFRGFSEGCVPPQCKRDPSRPDIWYWPVDERTSDAAIMGTWAETALREARAAKKVEDRTRKSRPPTPTRETPQLTVGPLPQV
jgi:hypothetical protein